MLLFEIPFVCLMWFSILIYYYYSLFKLATKLHRRTCNRISKNKGDFAKKNFNAEALLTLPTYFFLSITVSHLVF